MPRDNGDGRGNRSRPSANLVSVDGMSADLVQRRIAVRVRPPERDDIREAQGCRTIARCPRGSSGVWTPTQVNCGACALTPAQ